MTDTLTREEVEAKLKELDQKYAQVAELEMGQLAARADELGQSMQAFAQALGPAGADIDDDTLAAVGQLQATNRSVGETSATASREAGEVSAHVVAALESVGAGRQMSEAVQAHKGAAKTSFYKPS